VLIQHKEEVNAATWPTPPSLRSCSSCSSASSAQEIADFRAAVEQFKADLPTVLQALRTMIDKQETGNADFRAAQARFLTHAQEAINPNADRRRRARDADPAHPDRGNLCQRLQRQRLSPAQQRRPRAVRAGRRFLHRRAEEEHPQGPGTLLRRHPRRRRADQQPRRKQTFLKVIYENFYKVYNTKAADRLGVVYTPNEIVRFMIDGADWLCETHFGKNLIDRDVDILDPATGTGTYICELLEHFRGQPKKLEHKYKHELHANEVAILPYYVANLNIESTYAAITGQYAEFPNLCFVDTLDNVGLHTAARGTTAELFGSVSEENVARIKRQNSRKISVVIGNPPYNANQANENDNNKNREYPQIDPASRPPTSPRAPRRRPSSTTCTRASSAGPATGSMRTACWPS
jgi:hypothetical protein